MGIMDFNAVSKISTLLSKAFAEDLLRLLVTYHTISASEAASRLNLHIKTAQDFLEGLEGLGYVSKEEVFEGKRPYFRYTLIKEKIEIEFDLGELKGNIGNQNYEIPKDLDVDQYNSVVIYCVPFHVVFSVATLMGN